MMVSTAVDPDTDPALRGLRDVHAPVSVATYIGDLWDRRSFIAYESVNELRRRQVHNVLGNLWHLLNPILSIAVFFLIFGLLLGTDRGVENFFLFLTVGLFVFQFTQKGTLDGSKAIINNRGLIKAVRFPRALLPITSSVTELIAALPTFLVMFAIAILTGTAPRWSWPLVFGLLAIQFVFTTGAAMIAARLTVHFADTTQILPFAFRLLLYGSGVIYSVDAYIEDNTLAEVLFVLNPMYCFIELNRWAVMGGSFPGILLVSAIAWSIVILVAGFLWFRAAEEIYSRD